MLLVAWIAWEAVQRINAPGEVLAGPMLAIAVVGLLVNVAGACLLWSGNASDSNLHGAPLHGPGDLVGSVGAIAAAIGIMLTGWTLLAPLLSVMVAGLVARSAWTLVSDSLRVLLQAAPLGVDARQAETGIRSLPGVAEAGHFHAWTLADETIIATVHVSANPTVMRWRFSRSFRTGSRAATGSSM